MSRDMKQLAGIAVAIVLSAVGAVVYGNRVINQAMSKNVDQTRQTASMELVGTESEPILIVADSYNSDTDLLQGTVGVNSYLFNGDYSITLKSCGYRVCYNTFTPVTQSTNEESEQNMNTISNTPSTSPNVDQTAPADATPTIQTRPQPQPPHHSQSESTMEFN